MQSLLRLSQPRIPILLDHHWQARSRKLLIQANRNGFLCVLDRAGGELLSGKPFALTTWAKEIGLDPRPVRQRTDSHRYTYLSRSARRKELVLPSYDPQTHYLYLATSQECGLFSGAPQKYL